jgi:hypothetical protein
MSTLNQQQLDDLSQRYGVSSDAVAVLHRAIEAGHGRMAQFNHPDLGGPGQWSEGGMIMIGDMFNAELKNKVGQLCAELAKLPRESERGTADVNSGDWWGADFGRAGSTGSQNEIHYAYFPVAHRLAIKIGSEVTIYDTADHQINGVSQEQSGDASLTFDSQRGLVRVADLPVVSRP